MSQSTPNSTNPANDPSLPPDASVPPGQTPPPQGPLPRKKKRWWLRIIGVLLLLLILLILLAPTIAGMGFVRSIVVGKVNENLNGSVEIGNYSVGWTGGISANDVKIYDDQKNLILQLNKFSTSLSLLNAMKGNLALGDTVVDVDLVRAEIGDDGQLNYAKLIKQVVKHKSGGGEPKETSSDAATTALPAVSGSLTVNYKGTIFQNGAALVQIQPSTAVIKIPGINDPISNDVTLKYSVNGGSVGTIHIAGNASAVKNSQLDLNQATADEKLDLADVDLKALSPLLKILMPAMNIQTEGITAGSMEIKASGVDSMTAGGQINVSKFAVSGAPLKGNDRLAIDQIVVPIDISRTTKNGQPFIDVKHADVLLSGKGGGQLGKITIAASAPQDALISAAALVPAVLQRALLGKEPAAESLIVNGEGTATITADFDIAALASQLPTTIGLQKGTTLTRGHLTHLTTIAISKDTAKIDSDTKLPDLQGTTDGKPVQLSPIDISAGLSAVGGTTPDVRDLKVNLSSGFLNVSGGGTTLSQEKLTGSFDLANLQTQAAQFVDLDTILNPPSGATTAPAVQVKPPHVQLAGAGTFDLSTDGDLIKPDGQGKVATSLTITGIDASGIGTMPPVKLTNLNATLSGDLHRGAATVDYKNFVAAITAAGITLAGKDAAAPSILDNETITANLNGDVSLPTGDGPQLINLATLEVKSSSNLFGVLSDSKTPDALTLSSEKGIIKANGTVAITADLKKLVDLSQRFTATGANPLTPQVASTSSGQLQSGQLNGTLKLARGNAAQTDVSFDGAISNLTVTTQQKPISNETIKLALHAISPDDRLSLQADASLDSHFMSAKLTSASLKLPGTQPGAPAVGMWDMLQKADVDLNVPDLPAVYAIINAFSPPAAEASAILPEFNQPNDHGGARIIATALDPTTETPPPNETPLEAARRRKRERAAAKAAQTTQPQAETPAAPLAPLQITSGSMSGKISILRDTASQTTTLNVTDLGLSKLALARGDSKYAFAHDLDFKFAMAVKASDNDTKLSPIAQIQQIQVTQLDGDVGVAKLSMPQPIVISNPADLNQIDAHGTIKLDGALGDATPLLAVLQGAPKAMPYGGTFDVSQAIHSSTAAQGNLLNLAGTTNVTNFQVLDDSGKAVYTEPSIAIKNDLDYIIAKIQPAPQPAPDAATAPTTAPNARTVRTNDQAIVRSLTVQMPSSQALAISFAGRVVDPFNKRVIKGIGQDPAAKLDLTYDLAKLWPIVKPTLADDMQAKYKNLKVVGKEERVFSVSGYFPLAKTVAESMRHLNADGGLALDELDLPQGLTITKLDLPFKMTAGVIQTAPSATPQTVGADTTQPVIANTAICNQGAVDLSSITLDMGQPSPVLGIAPNHKLLQSVHINPVLAGTLGAGNLLFKDATKATGLLDITVVQCDKVPLGDLIAQRPDANATILYSVSDLSIDGPVPQVLSSVLPLGGQGIHGGIQDGKLTVANGEANNDFALNIIRYEKPTLNGQPDSSGTVSQTPTDTTGEQLVPVNLPMKFSGGVSLTTGLLKNFLVNVPRGLLPSKAASLFPNGLTVPITGDSGHPKFDIQKAIVANAGSGLLNGSGNGGAGGLLDGLLNKHKKKPADNTDSGGQ